MMRICVRLLPLIVVALSGNNISNTRDKKGNEWASAINATVDPCENFHEFACGRWKPDVEMSDSTGAIDETRMKWAKDTSELLQSNDVSNSRAVRKARAVYRACMNYTEEARKSDFIAGVKRLLGMFSVEHKKAKMNLTSMLVEMRLLDPPFLDVSIQPDRANKSRNVIRVSKSKSTLLGIPARYIYSSSHKDRFTVYKDNLARSVTIIAKQNFSTLNYNAVRRDIDDAMNFQTSVKYLGMGHYAVRRTTLSEFNVNTFSLRDYLHSIAPPELHSYLNSDPEILVANVKYFEELVDFLSNTRPEVIINYFILAYAEHAFSPIEKRWFYCTEKTRKILPFAVNALYASKYFDRKYKERGDEIAEAVRSTILEMLQELNFTSEESKKRVVDVVASMRFEIGDAEYIHNTTEVDDFYHELDINESQSFGEMKRIYAAWETKAKLSELVVRDNRRRWHEHALAGYISGDNIMLIAMPMLKQLFSPEHPMPVNWGSIGFTVAHEIMHGLNTNEIQELFGNGMHKIYELWDADASIHPFQQCLIKQYSSEWVPEVSKHLNANQTIGEDTVDNAGIAAAFRAFEKNRKEHGSANLDEYSSKQLFFISYAQVFCGTETGEHLIFNYHHDVHTLHRYRTNFVLRNQKAFADAFQCPVGSPMNPVHKCHFW